LDCGIEEVHGLPRLPVNAARARFRPARAALTAIYAVNAAHAVDSMVRAALTGGPGPSSMPQLTFAEAAARPM
jgi:hypothetical protein